MNTIKNAAAKTAYAQPKLTVYGAFAELTAAGSGTRVEGGAMTSPLRRP